MGSASASIDRPWHARRCRRDRWHQPAWRVGLDAHGAVSDMPSCGLQVLRKLLGLVRQYKHAQPKVDGEPVVAHKSVQQLQCTGRRSELRSRGEGACAKHTRTAFLLLGQATMCCMSSAPATAGRGAYLKLHGIVRVDLGEMVDVYQVQGVCVLVRCVCPAQCPHCPACRVLASSDTLAGCRVPEHEDN